MATNIREARRRKIVDRGSDRLALITGRIQTLPSSPEENTTDSGSDPSSQPLISHDQHLQPTGTLSLYNIYIYIYIYILFVLNSVM
jgi:hypothetical protein